MEDIRAHISEEYALSYSRSGCIKLMARLGFEYRRPNPLPILAPAEQQAEFIVDYERL